MRLHAGMISVSSIGSALVPGWSHQVLPNCFVVRLPAMADTAAEELSTDEAGRMSDLLASLGQEHLLSDLDDPARRRLLVQIKHLDANYSGGLSTYIGNARRLLEASRKGDNPFEGCTPTVPTGERVTIGDERHKRLEVRGLQEVRRAAFVLVAGGLGERLGFSGIKLALPVTVLAGWTYLEFFCRSILALQSRPESDGDEAMPATIPFVIMTSGDTHARTLQLLEESNYFGLAREQIHVLLQEKVACLMDTEAHLAPDPKEPGSIETKPHGHGDVHALLHTTGLAERFLAEGRRWLFFFQDTNAMVFKVAALATMGVSAELGFDMNSVAVPRRPKDAMGGIARLTREDGPSLTINVEYNQLDPLLRATTYPDGDSADATGFSPFPGNMNTLVLSLASYVDTLKRTSGIIAEFVNPKYADGTRTKFKSSTRLECMMQDLPKEFSAEAKVGFTQFDLWCSYSPVKNSPEAARKNFLSNNHPQSGTTGETDLFIANCRLLRMAGADIAEPMKATFNGIEVDLEARVVWSPAWAVSYEDICNRLAPSARLRISQRSTLLLDGDIIFDGELTLDGALSIKALPGSSVRVRRLSVANDGWTLAPTGGDETDEVSKIRGFRVNRLACEDLHFDAPGEHIIDVAPAA